MYIYRQNIDSASVWSYGTNVEASKAVLLVNFFSQELVNLLTCDVFWMLISVD